MFNESVNIRDTAIGKFIRYPIQRVHIELTNLCNFDCVFCPKSVMTRPTGFMKKEMAKRIIDEIAQQKISEKVTFHVMGEPIMHPGLLDILEHCNARNIDAGITTNGSLLNKKNIDMLVKANVHQTNISLQTPDEKSFALRKASPSLGYQQYADKVTDYIRNLKENNRKTIIKIHLLNTKFGGDMRKHLDGIETISDTPTLQAVLAEWTNKIYSINCIGNLEQKNRVLREIAKVTVNKWNVLEIAPKIFLETYVLDSWGNAFADKNIFKASIGYCSAMRDHFGILYDGKMILCCRDYDGNTGIGNVNDSSIVELLNSDNVLKVVRGFGRYRIVHPYCKRCLGGKSFSSAVLKQFGSVFFMKAMKWYFYNNKKLY